MTEDGETEVRPWEGGGTWRQVEGHTLDMNQ